MVDMSVPQGDADNRRVDSDPSAAAERDRSTLDDEYREMIARVEALPQNQSGADKCWVWETLAESEADYARSRRRLYSWIASRQSFATCGTRTWASW